MIDEFEYDKVDNPEEGTVQEEEQEDGFMRGYLDEEDVKECAECGAAINEEKEVVKEIEEETYHFCSEACAKEFEDTIG
ncbi:hypothetical protein COV20_00065 [Candidatus Woesearchaeota archaeon CG10_big_fil_rev_8_21_14_0_10_45_16]|nr:MAG: hypothetical protein COV20_00065 [Candidatus Woesearchaeota archaeon CG10_big_fil_rev_8_21_14_0_10_45_16]